MGRMVEGHPVVFELQKEADDRPSVGVLCIGPDRFRLYAEGRGFADYAGPILDGVAVQRLATGPHSRTMAGRLVRAMGGVIRDPHTRATDAETESILRDGGAIE